MSTCCALSGRLASIICGVLSDIDVAIFTVRLSALHVAAAAATNLTSLRRLSLHVNCLRELTADIAALSGVQEVDLSLELACCQRVQLALAVT